MKAEEKKLSSIPRAIGLFMIFKALFYRNSFEGASFPDGAFYDYVQFAEAAGFYLFLIIGTGLCISQRFIFYWLAWFSCAVTLFGSIHTMAIGKENFTITFSLVTAHVILCSVLLWSMQMIKKMLEKQAGQN